MCPVALLIVEKAICWDKDAGCTWWDTTEKIYHHTELRRVWNSMHLKTCSQNAEIKLAEIKLSKEQTHIFDASFLKTSKTGDGTKQF